MNLRVIEYKKRNDESFLNGVRPCACGDAPGVSAGARAPTRTASDDSRNSRRRSDNTMRRGTCESELLNQTEANLPFQLETRGPFTMEASIGSYTVAEACAHCPGMSFRPSNLALINLFPLKT